jgi:hypothetical protein
MELGITALVDAGSATESVALLPPEFLDMAFLVVETFFFTE